MTEPLKEESQTQISEGTSAYVSRAYNYFSNLPFGYVKKGSFSMKLADEIMYYATIQHNTEQAMFFPRMKEHFVGKYNWIILEKYAYPNLGELLLHNKNEYNPAWSAEFKGLRAILDKFATWEDPQSLHNENNAYKMYIEKTEREFEAFKDSREDLSKMFVYNELTINEQKYVNFPRLWEIIKPYIIENLLDYNSVMIHGDFCLSNILYGQDATQAVFKLIDPRGSFGKIGIYGDQRYDVAKLMHSVDGGYEFFINDHFRVRQDGSEFELKFTRDHLKQTALDQFEKVFFTNRPKKPGFKKKEIKLIQGLIYIGMCRRHYDDQKRQLGLFLTGVKLLNEAIQMDEIEP